MEAAASTPPATSLRRAWSAFGAGIHRDRVADEPKPAGAIGEGPGMVGISGQIALLVRVSGEIDELRSLADILDVLEAPVTEHEGGIHRAFGVVLGEDGALGGLQAVGVENRESREGCRVEHGIPGPVEQGRKQIDVRNRGSDDCPGTHIWTGYHEGDPDRLLIHEVFEPETMHTGALAMVGGVDHEGVGGPTRLCQSLEHLTHPGIEETAESKVCAQRRPVVVVGEGPPGETECPLEYLDRRVVPWRRLRQRQRRGVVSIEELGGRDQGRVG
ncbi:MAG TPA: hypothetical protein VMS74_06030 [Acidimicrobiia bacterium]|nr:hypothetical protein [Acidimicrobiia bacterium]